MITAAALLSCTLPPPGLLMFACWTCGNLTEVGTAVKEGDNIICDDCQPSERSMLEAYDPDWGPL